MKMIEMCTCVDKDGRLVISETIVEEAGFNPGDEVHVSLAAAKSETYRSSMSLRTAEHSDTVVYPDDVDKFAPEDELCIPGEMLEAAGIPKDSDLIIIYTDGAIVITESDILDNLPDELRELFANIGVNPDTVREVMRKEGYFV
jgi:bifunctional DNA-binding transcriptional regulator/antitoxin component of YhaV-PrlF toxin-antitoxin module